MTNSYAHDPDCDFWFDHDEQECTCSRPDLRPPAADPAQDLRAIRVEITELKRRIDDLEARGCDRFLVRLNAPPNISPGDEKAPPPTGHMAPYPAAAEMEASSPPPAFP
jgi:hypothetical protein